MGDLLGGGLTQTNPATGNPYGEISHHHFMDPQEQMPQELQDAYQRHQRELEEGARNQGLPPGVFIDTMDIKPWDQWLMDHPGPGQYNPGQPGGFIPNPVIQDPVASPGVLPPPQTAPVLDPMNNLPPLPNPQPTPMPAPVAQPVPQPTGPVAPVTRGKPLQPAAAFSPTTRGGAVQSAPRTNTQTPQARKPLPPARGAYQTPKATGPVRPKPLKPAMRPYVPVKLK
jgi:hypothetical protein